MHKHHHVFFNPSPFAVIADEYVDQFFRALPLLLFPMVAPLNMDVMFGTYGAFFYAYGVYLHWGYESTWLDAHNPIMNTAFQHYCHHAKAILNKPCVHPRANRARERSECKAGVCPPAAEAGERAKRASF